MRILLTAITVASMMAASTIATFPVGKEQVDMLLVLASDVSYSVDEAEFKLQRQGYADAITDKLVLAASTSGRRGRIAVSYIEWAEPWQQRVIMNWAVVHNRESAQVVADELLKVPRSFRGWTAMGDAILASIAHIEKSPYDAEHLIIDISSDGTSNKGSSVTAARDVAVRKGITINALVVLSPTPHPVYPEHTHPPGGLKKYFEDNVIGGPGSFAHAIEGYESFGKAIKKKLTTEIAHHSPR